MQNIFTLFITLVFFIGCGLMGTSKGENTEPKQIHVPQKITIELPNILKQSKSDNQTKKTEYKKWYQ